MTLTICTPPQGCEVLLVAVSVAVRLIGDSGRGCRPIRCPSSANSGPTVRGGHRDSRCQTPVPTLTGDASTAVHGLGERPTSVTTCTARSGCPETPELASQPDARSPWASFRSSQPYSNPAAPKRTSPLLRPPVTVAVVTGHAVCMPEVGTCSHAGCLRRPGSCCVPMKCTVKRLSYAALRGRERVQNAVRQVTGEFVCAG